MNHKKCQNCLKPLSDSEEMAILRFVCQESKKNMVTGLRLKMFADWLNGHESEVAALLINYAKGGALLAIHKLQITGRLAFNDKKNAKCLGYELDTINGKEYDCGYEHSAGINCEHCLFGLKVPPVKDPRIPPAD